MLTQAPPVIVNIPPASGPPWWATAIIALISALLAGIGTAYISRSREHRKWIHEKRLEHYMRLWEIACSAEVKSKGLTIPKKLHEENLYAQHVFFSSAKVQEIVFEDAQRTLLGANPLLLLTMAKEAYKPPKVIRLGGFRHEHRREFYSLS